MLLLLLAPAFAAPPAWFGAPVAVTPPMDWGADLKTGDFNADGVPDISVATGASSSWSDADRPFSLSLALSDGAGGFTSVSVPTSLLSGYTMVTDVADLDGDGDADLVAGHTGGFSVFFSDGATLATEVDYAGARVGPVELGDIDGDGDIDLLTLDDAGDAVVWANDGAGGFTFTQSLPTGAGPVVDYEWDSIDLVDLDVDGALDVIVLVAEASMLGTDPLIAYLGDGSGGFDPTPLSSAASGYGVYDLAVGDIDGEGHVDLVFAGGGDWVDTIRWDGGYGAPTSWPIGTYAYNWVLTGDIDGDADTDAVGTAGFDIGVLLQEGGVLVDQGAVYPMQTTCGWAVANDGIELADMNGDGCADVVAASYGVGAVILPATGPACIGATPVAWSSGTETGDTGTADTGTADTAIEDSGADTGSGDSGDTGVAPRPSPPRLCAVATPQAGSLALVGLAGLALLRRRSALAR